MSEIVIINIIAAIISIIASGYIFFLAYRFKNLRLEFIMIALGIFISIGIHSIFELIEPLGFIDINYLIIIMPLFVLSGMIFILVGCVRFYKIFNNPSMKIGVIKK